MSSNWNCFREFFSKMAPKWKFPTQLSNCHHKPWVILILFDFHGKQKVELGLIEKWYRIDKCRSSSIERNGIRGNLNIPVYDSAPRTRFNQKRMKMKNKKKRYNIRPVRFRSYRLVKIHSDASSNDKKWNTAINFSNQHDIKIRNIIVWKRNCSFFLNNRFINENFLKFFHKRMKWNSEYYIAKLRKFYFFEIRNSFNNKIGHENIIFYCKFFHVFIEFFFFFFTKQWN